jgi:prevent-host-death family protein
MYNVVTKKERLMNEIRVGTRELKTNLSKYLRRVKAGETIIVTERGKEIGQIMPVAQSMEERMKTLTEAGFLKWNGKKVEPYEPIAINLSGKQVSDLIVEDRDAASYLHR